jgi:hypothetical protein
MPLKILKADITNAMRTISGEDMLLDEFVLRLVVLSKVRAGIDQTGEGLDHGTVIREFNKPRTERTWNRGADPES